MKPRPRKPAERRAIRWVTFRLTAAAEEAWTASFPPPSGSRALRALALRAIQAVRAADAMPGGGEAARLALLTGQFDIVPRKAEGEAPHGQQ